MKFIGRFIFHFLSNGIALWICTKFVAGFIFTGNLTELAIAAFVFTLINTFLRPFVKMILGPFVVLTFGLFTIVINAAMLYLLDIWSPALTIQGYVPLLLATLIIGFINATLSLATKDS